MTSKSSAEISLQQLDSRIAKQVRDMERVLPTNWQYASMVLIDILRRYPECLPIRKILRNAQGPLAQSRQSPNFLGPKYVFRKCEFYAKVYFGYRLSPYAVLQLAERHLCRFPSDGFVHLAMAKAAASLAMWQTAAFAYEQLLVSIPISEKSQHMAYALALVNAQRSEDAISVLEEILRYRPNHVQAQDLLKKIWVTDSLQRIKP